MTAPEFPIALVENDSGGGGGVLAVMKNTRQENTRPAQAALNCNIDFSFQPPSPPSEPSSPPAFTH